MTGSTPAFGLLATFIIEGGAPRRLKYGSAARPDWSIAGAGMPFIYKDRIYYRSFDFLRCIARR